jgi:hypothetical protein
VRCNKGRLPGRFHDGKMRINGAQDALAHLSFFSPTLSGQSTSTVNLPRSIVGIQSGEYTP